MAGCCGGVVEVYMARILVIDDEPAMRMMLEQALKSAGYEVISAADGREGLNWQRTVGADVVITDLFMPGQDGLETIMEIRKTSVHVAVIAISGNPIARAMLAVATQLGAVTVLEKPFHPHELLGAVARALRSKTRSAAGLERQRA
jgi:DNA-binding NtrC family response regulator